MSIENPINKFDADDELVETMESKINEFLKFNEEYQKRNFTADEIHKAAILLSNANVSASDKELAKKALDARLAARRISEAA